MEEKGRGTKESTKKKGKTSSKRVPGLDPGSFGVEIVRLTNSAACTPAVRKGLVEIYITDTDMLAD